MTMELHDAANGDGLFDVQGKAIAVISSLNTARGTTIPTAVQAVVDQFEGISGMDLDFQEIVEGLSAATTGWDSQGGGLASTMQAFCRNLLAGFVDDDSSALDQSLTAQLEYLIEQMEDDDDYVTPNTVGGTLSAGGSNTGDPQIVWTSARGDGRESENMVAETISITVASISGSSFTLSFAGQQSTGSLDSDWPEGSGAKKSISARTPSQSLISGGGFSEG